MKTIKSQQLKARLDQGLATIIDVLPPEVFERRHIPGARNACVYEVAFGDTMAAIAPDKSAEIAVYGSDGERQAAPVAAAKLEALGYTDVSVLEGGLCAWRFAGLEVTGAEPTSPEDPCPPVLPGDATLLLDLEKSLVRWSGRNANGSHEGTLRFADGSVRIADGRVTGAVEVDMESLAVTDLAGDAAAGLVAHLRTDDFFLVGEHPLATFRIDDVALRSIASPTSPSVDVKGTLAIRGIERPVSFPATTTMLPGAA